MCDAPWFIQIAQEKIEDVTQARCCVTRTVSEMEPAFFRFDGRWPESVL